MELAVVFSNVQNEVKELLKEKKKKLTYNDICHYLSIQDKNRKRELNEVLNYLIAEGIILETRKGYSLIDKKSNIIVGELRIIKSGNGYIDKYFVDKKILEMLIMEIQWRLNLCTLMVKRGELLEMF